MINFNTVFRPSDNSGFKKAKCLGSVNNIKNLNINNICIAVVKSCKRKSKLVKKSDIIRTLVTHTKLYNFKKYKSIKFHNNSLVLLNKKSYSIGEDKYQLKDTSKIKLIGIIPSLVMDKLSKYKLNLKKATFI
uniref:Ribosomal protein L14 n=2 Tax=Babesia TaxID=5864 RepID=A0A411ADJ2_9APIC|nr:ribosomal protein L14 [Babesia sp. Lintan]QAX27031.1 ribosomal protein L14 [Babesia motasi]QAX27062.1 ribosomal protein L14 [Babesia motasi]